MKNQQNNNEFSDAHPDDEDDYIDEQDEQSDPDEDFDDSDENLDDSDEDLDDEDEGDQDDAPAPSRQPGRGLRSLPVAEEEEELPPSKTKIKKQMHELRDLGEELTELGKDQIAQLDIPEILRDAIKEMHRIKTFGAKRRQLQYIGKLMRDVDAAPIIAKLNTWKGTSQQHIGYMHQLERWRERLLEGNEALTELLAAYPDTDVQRLRTLIRNTLKEREAGKPAKNFREIFQVLRETIPEPV
ncbi:MAG: ribosome biogenesis factor YjgA [Gallionella sp.]